MNNWTPCALGDLIDIKHGFAFKGEFFRDTPPGDILLTPGNFAIGGGFQFGKLKYYDGPPAPGYVLSAGELLVTMTDLSKAGDTLGYPAIVPGDGSTYLHNQRLGKVVLISDRVSRDFVYWLMRTTAYRAEVLASCTGSTVKHTSPGRIRAFKFLLPPRLEQDRICTTLGSLDDKIELNRRMNETLEAMAQAIFRDWFVDFGPTRRKIDGATDPMEIMGGLVSDPHRARELADLFPVKMGDGGLPEGWEEKPLGNVFDVVMGQSPPSSTYNEAGNGLPFFQGRRDFGFRFPEERVYCTDPSRIANADWTLVSVRAPVGDVNRATTRCCIGRGVAAVCHKTDLRSFTYYAVLTLKPELARFDGDGTVFGSINQKQMKALAVVGADYPVAQEFEKIAAPIDGLIRSRTEETRTLAITRDLLLPKLMSGEIRLRDAERMIEAVA